MKSSNPAQHVFPGPASATFRALAWSEDGDSIADPVPYIGGQYPVSAGPRPGRLALLCAVGAGIAAIAVGGLTLHITEPAAATSGVSAPSVSVPPATPATGGAVDLRPTLPSRVVGSTAGTTASPAPVEIVPAAVASGEAAPGEVAPAVTAPAASAPAAPAPAESMPAAVTTSEAPAAPAPPAAPPVFTPPFVSLPEVMPQPVPHPVGPTVFQVPAEPEESNPAIPAPPVLIHVPAAPPAPNPGIALKPGMTVSPFVPKLP